MKRNPISLAIATALAVSLAAPVFAGSERGEGYSQSQGPSHSAPISDVPSFQSLDTNGDDQIQSAEAEGKIEAEAFESADADGNEQLSRSEYQAMHQQTAHSMGEERGQGNASDRDSDPGTSPVGSVAQEATPEIETSAQAKSKAQIEAEEAQAAAVSIENEAEPEGAMAEVEADAEGGLAQTETEPQPAGNVEVPTDDTVAIQSFTSLDADNDGYVSSSEAQADATLSKNWNEADLNADGHLDQSEFSAFEGGEADLSPLEPDPSQRPKKEEKGEE